MSETFEISVEDFDTNKRLDGFLSDKLEKYSRNFIQNLINESRITVDGKIVKKNSYKLKGYEEIEIEIPDDELLNVEAENIPLDIVYEDNDFVIINKSSNMVVHPAPGNYNGTLVNAVLYHIKDLSSINGIIRPGIVHRLDKDTSGLIVVAKNDIVHRKLTEMFKEKTIEKTYLAIIKGKLRDKKIKVHTLIGRNRKDRKKMTVVESNGKEAVSKFTVIDEKDNYSLVKAEIETGRTHQIRVHLKYLNNPIVGDELYGKADKLANRQMLHAYRLIFKHPITNEEIKIYAKIPEDFIKVINELGFDLERSEFTKI